MRYIILFIILMGCAFLPFPAARAQQWIDPSSGDTAHYPYWIQMMQDPNANFHATQSAFEKYWKDRTDYKGNGWKVFRRWEYIHQDMVQPDGKLPSPGSILNEYLNYEATHSPMSANGNWQQIGPVALPGNATSQPNGMGRINAVAFHPSSAGTIFIGSPSGGFWKTTDGGVTWSVLTTTTPSLGVSSILVHPTSTNTILIGTGDRDAGDAPGIGVYKSTDGGVTWTASNLGMGNATVGMMIMHPSNPSLILAATSSGIYKSTDGGATWTRKSSNANNYKDIKFNPTDPTIVYATEAGKFYRSTNTGDSWTQITSGVITGTRLVIGVSQSQPTWVYLCQTNGPFAGLLKSTDNGLNFTTQSTTPNIMDYSCDGSGTSSQAWYDLCIAVDPNNANIIYVGGVNIFKSTNGGATGSWIINAHWVGSSWGVSCAPSVHADIHALVWSPLNGNLYSGGDGGIYYTSNGGTSWTDISSGLAIAQVYKIGQSATKQGLTMNGYQDNGTACNTGSAFTTVIGGDGMECLIDYLDTNYRYGELYYGAIYRTTGTGYGSIKNNISETGAWVTPYVLHATNPNTMFAGFKNVWRSNNVKASNSGSVSWTAISSGESSTCAVLEESPANPDILYVVRAGSLKRTDNATAGTVTWTTCNLPGGITPTDLASHPTDPMVVYATAGANVYKSTDKGMTWTTITGTLPSITINCIVYDKNMNEGLYIGNKTGVYYKDGNLSDWIQFSTGLPLVDVRELEIYYDVTNPGNNRLKAATYGRGLWETEMMGVLSVVPSNQNVPYTAGTTNFTVACNTNWAAITSSPWCAITPSGFGNGTIAANYSENPTVNQRIASIIVTGGNAPIQTVTVTQAGAPPSLSVIPSNQNVPPPADTTFFSIICNTNWTVVCDSAWCTVTPSGSGNGTISAIYTENFSVNQRIAHITVSVAGLPDQVVTVTQEGAAPILGVVPLNQDVSYPAGSTSFSVTSNTTWIVTCDSSWCIVTPSGSGNGNIIANYLENFTVNPRIADITVTVSGLPSQTVTVTQAGAPPLLAVTPPNQNVNALAGLTNFTVTSNTNWTASSDSTWCTVTPSGSGNGTIVADYLENPYYFQRIANINVTVTGLPPQTVTVTQDHSTVAIPGNYKNDIRIYPNPSKGQFVLETTLDREMKVNIMDLSGQVILSRICKGEKVYRFDLSSFPSGCYFVKIKTDKVVLNERLVLMK